MGTFFFTVEVLSNIPEVNFDYAKKLLSIFIENILELEEINTAVSISKNETKSVLTLTNDEFESVIVHLTFCPRENSDDYEDSKFYYTIHKSSLLEKMIPEGLRLLWRKLLLKENLN